MGKTKTWVDETCKTLDYLLVQCAVHDASITGGEVTETELRLYLSPVLKDGNAYLQLDSALPALRSFTRFAAAQLSVGEMPGCAILSLPLPDELVMPIVPVLPTNSVIDILRGMSDEVICDVARCRALLLDLLPHEKQLVYLLSACVEERIVSEMRASILPLVQFARWCKRLEDNRGIAGGKARQAVSLWAEALGLPIPNLPLVINPVPHYADEGDVPPQWWTNIVIPPCQDYYAPGASPRQPAPIPPKR